MISSVTLTLLNFATARGVISSLPSGARITGFTANRRDARGDFQLTVLPRSHRCPRSARRDRATL
jgi:hypothetical protein